jgi:ribosomal protein L13E
VTKSLDDVIKAQNNLGKSSKQMDAASQNQIKTLQQLVEAHTREKKALSDSAALYRFHATLRREAADASRKELEQLQKQARIEGALATQKEKRDIEEVARIRLEVAEREALGEVQDKEYKAETARLRKEAALIQALANESSAANRRQAAELGVQIANRQQDTRDRNRAATVAESNARIEEQSHNRVTRALRTAETQLERLTSTSSGAERSTSRFGRTLDRLGIATGGARSSLRGLNAEFQGFQLALVIKYAQALISVLISLGGQLVAIASAAGQAAVGLGAALASGAAQAVPVIGVLAAALGRLTTILKAVKLQNQQQLTATKDAAAGARQQSAAADSIRSAEQSVADAHRNTARAVSDLAQTRSDAARQELQAQREVNQSRKDAIRTVQDLIAAEQGAVQSVEQAQQGLQSAISSGDVAGTAQAQIDLRQARTGLTRARQDVAPVRARGVEGVDAVIQAEQRLGDVRRTNARQIASSEQGVADARRQEIRATDDLARTRRTAAENVAQETASVDKLTDSLKQLSPAERNLYRRILALQDAYKRAARPITDIIINAFSDVVDRVIVILRDPRILRGFRNIATQIAGAIRRVTGVAGGERSIGAFQILSAEATRNIPIATGILIDFFNAARNIVLAAVPAFRLLLGYVADYAGKASDATENSKGLSDFFVTGVQYAKSFFDLLLSIAGLFLTIAGRDGAAGEGIKTIDELTRRVNHLTDRARDNAGSIRDFFAQTRTVFFAVLSVVTTLASTIASTFSVSAVTSFADFLNRGIIPAIGNVIQIMGALVTLFHQLFSLPGVAPFVQFAGTLLLFAKGMTIIRGAVTGVLEILPNAMKAFGLLVPVIDKATGAVTGFQLAAGGFIVIAIAAIIGAIILLDRHFHFLGPTFRWLKGAASDAFDWIKQAAKDVVDWFSDVWTQGLLYWIRYPFIQLSKFLGHSDLFQSIVSASKALIGFFAGPAWAVLKAWIVVPFELARAAVDVIWGAIQTIVVVGLDVLSGRFSRIGPHLAAIWKGIWDGIRSALIDAMNGLIGIVNAAIDAINKVSPFGDIGHIQKLSDDTKDATDSVGEHFDTLGDKSKTAADRVSDSMRDISRATGKAATASKREFDKLFDSTKVTLSDIKDVVRINSENIASTLGKKSAAGKEAMADNFRQAQEAVKKQMDAGKLTTRRGMEAIRGYLADELQTYGLSIRQARTLAAARARGDTETSFSGGHEEGHAGPGHAGGGMVSGYGGWPRDDHMVVDPYGRVSTMLSGNEGIVNPPQMDRINRWGAIVKGLGLDNYGSLQEMWGMRGGGVLGGHSSKPARLQTGGQIVPVPGFPGERAARSILDEIAWVARKFRGLILTDAYGQGHKSPGHTRYGTAADFSGPDRLMDAAVRALTSRGYLVGYDGRFGSQSWPGHGPSTRTPNFHFHVEFGGKQRDLGNISSAIARRIPSIPIRGGGAVGRAVQRALYMVRAGAQSRLDAAAGSSLTTPVAGGGTRAMRTDANVVAAFRRAIRVMRANPTERLALWEAGIVESGLRNLPYGDRDSLGSLQERTSIYGRGHAMNPYASALRFLRQVIGRRPWRGTAGALAQFAQGSAFPGRYDAVRNKAIPYMRRGGMMQRLQGGGLLGGVARGTAPAFTQINTVLGGVANALEPFARAGSRARGLALRIQHAFTSLTTDGGLLDQLSDAVETIATRGATALQRLQFRITRGGAQRRYLAPEQLAQANLGIAQATGRGLQREGATLQNDLATAQEQLAVAQARRNQDAVKNARAAIINLRGRVEKNAAAIAQNAQDQVEAQEAFQQSLLDGVNTAADQQNSAIDRWSRVAKALGHTVDPNAVLGAQIGNMQRQIGGLRGVLARALRTGNIDLATTVRSQIEELNTQIAEAVAQQFQNSIDAVNNAAAASNARLDRAARRAQIGGQVDFAAMQSILGQRQGVFGTQRAGLAGLLNQAIATGNTDQIVNLTDQIDELDTAMAENTQAIRDNTDAAFNFRTQQINDTAGFAQTLFSGAQGFFQALTERTGINTIGQQATSLTGLATSLAAQQGGLKGQLATLLGYSPQEAQRLANLTGADLVSYLTSIASGPALDVILARLDPTQQTAFRDLISGLITNATATEQNTKALSDLTGSTGQSFSSSFWSAFRVAVFNGAGGLLPQYQTLVPSADIGARVINSGALMVHSGETVRPATVARDWNRGGAGDVFNLNVTTPTQVLDPVDVNRQLAFLRKTSGR